MENVASNYRGADCFVQPPALAPALMMRFDDCDWCWLAGNAQYWPTQPTPIIGRGETRTPGPGGAMDRPLKLQEDRSQWAEILHILSLLLELSKSRYWIKWCSIQVGGAEHGWRWTRSLKNKILKDYQSLNGLSDRKQGRRGEKGRGRY